MWEYSIIFQIFFHLIMLNLFSCQHIQINYLLLNFRSVICITDVLFIRWNVQRGFFFFSFYNYGCSKKDLVQISLYTFRTIVVSDKWDCWVNRYYTYFRLKGFPKLDTKRLYALDINLNFFFFRLIGKP